MNCFFLFGKTSKTLEISVSQYSEIAEDIRDSLYVDDLITRVVERGVRIREESEIS